MREIAAELGIKPDSARMAARRLYCKLNISGGRPALRHLVALPGHADTTTPATPPQIRAAS
jgi:hypothetical protein